MITSNFTVLHCDNSFFEMIHDVSVMCHENNRSSKVVNLLQKVDDLVRSNSVEVPGRLVGQDKFCPTNQRPGQSNSLALPSREQRGEVFCSLSKPYTLEQRLGPLTPFSPRDAAVAQRQRDVFRGRQRGDQVELLKDEADRWAGRDEIVALIKPWVNLRTLQDIRETFDEAGVCWGPYQSFSQVVEEDPRVSDNNPMFENVLNPGIGKVLTAGSPIDFSGAERTSPGGAPILGEHTEQVLAEELGLLDPQIGALIEKGIAGVPAT